MKLGFQGDGWAWVEPLLPCQEGKTSLQLMTTQADALLLYNGPMTTDDIVFDFFLLELVGGYPKVRVDMGDGELVLEITGRNEASDVRLDPLNDGTWHSIELFKNGKVSKATLHSYLIETTCFAFRFLHNIYFD